MRIVQKGVRNKLPCICYLLLHNRSREGGFHLDRYSMPVGRGLDWCSVGLLVAQVTTKKFKNATTAGNMGDLDGS